MKSAIKTVNGKREVHLVYTKGDQVYVCGGPYQGQGGFAVVKREGANGHYWVTPVAPYTTKEGKALTCIDEVQVLWNDMELCRLPK